jgi:hypothetical protein
MARLGEGAPWIYKIMSHIYTSLAFALKQNKLLLLKCSPKFRDIITRIERKQFSGNQYEIAKKLNFALKTAAKLVNGHKQIYVLLLFVWPPVGGGFLSLPPRLHGPKGQPPKFSRRENCWEVPKSHYAGVPCVLLSVTSLRYIRISTYMLTLVTSEVPRSLSRRKPRRFLRTHSRSIFPRY